MSNSKFMRQGIGNKEEAKGGTKRQAIALNQEKNRNEETDQVRVLGYGATSVKAVFLGVWARIKCL